MNIRLTEEMIRGRANDQSFEKGQSYYRSFWSHLQSNAGGCGRRRDIDGALRGKFRPIVSPACKVGFLLIFRSMSPLQKPFLNTKGTKATKEIQERFENVKPSRRLS